MSEISSIQKTFKGPNRWNQTRGEVIPYIKPELLHATMEWNGTVYEVMNGKLKVSVNHRTPHEIFLYFGFEYIHDGIQKSGRWYDKEFSPTLLKTITNNTLVYVINDFKDHDTSENPVVCTTRITLRPAVANWLRTLGETRPSPPVPTVLDSVYRYWDELCDFCTRPLCTCGRRRSSR
jgi:hypothetical protein